MSLIVGYKSEPGDYSPITSTLSAHLEDLLAGEKSDRPLKAALVGMNRLLELARLSYVKQEGFPPMPEIRGLGRYESRCSLFAYQRFVLDAYAYAKDSSKEYPEDAIENERDLRDLIHWNKLLEHLTEIPQVVRPVYERLKRFYDRITEISRERSTARSHASAMEDDDD